MYHSILETHLLYFMCEVQEESSANVAVELRKSFVFGEVGVPKSNCLINVEFSSKVARNPPVRKVHEIYVKFFKVFQNFRVGLVD